MSSKVKERRESGLTDSSTSETDLLDVNRNQASREPVRKMKQPIRKSKQSEDIELPFDWSVMRPLMTIFVPSLFVLFAAYVLRSEINASPRARPDVPTVGGWRVALPVDVELLERGIDGAKLKCNIDRVRVEDITAEDFESKYRFKKPVIIQFPNGAAGWTEPEKWSRDWLTQSYGEWKMLTGKSNDIVKQGGRGEVHSSLTDFVDYVMAEDTNDEPAYIFDREFYNHTQLPQTLHPPTYFTVNDTLDENIFFLGSAKSGVSFHKHTDAWNGVVYGRKRWFIYPTNTTPPAGIWPPLGALEWYTRVYPTLGESQRPLECIQEAGEILYIPESFYHSVINVGDTVAIGIQKRKSLQELERLFYEASDLERVQPNDTANVTKQRWAEAAVVYEKLQELLPTSSEVKMRLGLAYHHGGDTNKGIEICTKAVEMDPWFAIAMVNLANMHTAVGNTVQAEALYVRAISIAPLLWDCYYTYGDFLMFNSRYTEAINVFYHGYLLKPQQFLWQRVTWAAQHAGVTVQPPKSRSRVRRVAA